MELENKDSPVHGVTLPENVVSELKRLGRALESFSAAELESAVRACMMDGNLIDDPHGANFLDQLELTEAEKRGRNVMDEEDGDEQLANCDKSKHPNKIISFCKRLAESRLRRSPELYAIT